MRSRGRFLQVASLLLAATVVQAAPTPQVGTPTTFATGIAGPEGIAFTKKREIVVGTSTGELLIFDADGDRRTLTTLPSDLAGITVRRDGSILAAAFSADTVWSVDPSTGVASAFASGVDGPNFIVETKRRRVWVSATNSGTIVDITDPVHAVKASGLSFPNGMAIAKEGRQRYLYVAELLLNRIVRFPIAADESLGALEVYATGVSLPDGIAFDKRGNMLVVGGNRLDLVHAGTRQVETIMSGGSMNWPSNLAFGRGRAFSRKEFFTVNFGLPLGSGTFIQRFPYNIPGAPLIR